MLRERKAGRDPGPGPAANEPPATGQLRAEPLHPNRLRLVGEADETTRAAFEAALRGMSNGGDLHLDLAELAFIDVAGVGSLVELASTMRPHGRLVVHQPPPALRRILDLLW